MPSTQNEVLDELKCHASLLALNAALMLEPAAETVAVRAPVAHRAGGLAGHAPEPPPEL